MNALRDMFNTFYDNIPEWFRQPVLDAINTAEENKEDHVITPLSQLIVLLDRGQNNHAINIYMSNPATRRSSTRQFFFPHTLPENLYPEDVYAIPPAPTDILSLSLSPALSPELQMIPPPNHFALSMAMAGSPPSLIRSSSVPVDPFEQLRLLPSVAISSATFEDLGDNFLPSLAQALRMNANTLSQVPPRIDSFFQPDAAHAISAMASQVPNPEQAQAPSMIRRDPGIAPRIDSFFQPGVSHAISAMASQVPDPEQAQAPSVIRRALPNDIE
jgi:hypothetical protein